MRKSSISLRSSLLVITAILLTAVPTMADAVGPINTSGVPLVATGGEVRIYFAGSNAAFDSLLYLASPEPGQGPFFPNHSTQPGSMISLGTFAPGTVLTFRLEVISTGSQFFTGPAGSNPDNLVHAGYRLFVADSTIPVNGLLVGFEDIFGGGDFDFDDHLFVFTNVAPSTPVPEPASMLLLATGLAGIGNAVRKRRNFKLKGSGKL